MYLTPYVALLLVDEHQAREREAAARRRHRANDGRPPRLRYRVGQLMVRLGQRLADGGSAPAWSR